MSSSRLDGIFEGKDDAYDGVTVEMTNEPMDATVFASLLRASLSHWKSQNKKGIWIQLPIERANLIEPAVKIDSEFVEILAFRESHKSFFEKSDFFFLCMMRPTSFNILPQEAEIEDAQWKTYE